MKLEAAYTRWYSSKWSLSDYRAKRRKERQHGKKLAVRGAFDAATDNAQGAKWQ